MIDRDEIIREEGSCFPGKTYTEVVLEPAYNEAKVHLIEPMMAIHKAHLIMLHEQGMLSHEEAKAIARALKAVDVDAIRRSAYSTRWEDLFFRIESQLIETAGDAAGNLHLGRSRNDMGIAMYRMALRDRLLAAIRSGLRLMETLIAFAEEHVETIMLGYTHTQQAQPTTLAHYIMAVADSLSRDIRRFMSAYANCNRSSMGAAALTTSGFPINRHRVKELLGFDELVENSYDAIAGADYLGEAMAAVQLASINLGRFVQDLLVWSTQEFAILRVADPYVQISSIMPQKRNPVSLEHIRALLSSCAGNAQTVMTMLHNTPFGDIVDTEDDMQPYVWRSLELWEKICRLLARVVATMEVDKEVLRRRAEASFAVVTELADTLVRTDNLPFRTSHRIVSRVVKTALDNGLAAQQISLASVNEAAREIIGRELLIDPDTLRRALDPDHFVHIRSLPGGPSPGEMKRMIADRKERVAALLAWHVKASRKLRQALERLDQLLEQWS